VPERFHVLDLRNAFNVIEWEGGIGYYADKLAEIRGEDVSGVYAILDAQSLEVLYVGESHTGRLYDTITRHFRKWTLKNDPQGRRRGGTSYNREAVKLAYVITANHEAQDIQYEEIQRLNPADNAITGEATEPSAKPWER
jgi:hypothetical protein